MSVSIKVINEWSEGSMDFPNRNVQPQAVAPGAQNTAAGNFSQNSQKNNKSKHRNRGEVSRIVTVLLVAAIAVLIGAAITLAITSNSSIKSEDKYVDTTKLQAVFLNTGQVYFGHITSLNNKYFVVKDIYYLQTAGGASASGASSSTANTSVSLVKLGCELHEPYDQMVINRSQVAFWENLQDSGKVVQAIKQFKTQNPNGPNCTAASTNSSTSAPASSTTTQNSSTTKQ